MHLKISSAFAPSVVFQRSFHLGFSFTASFSSLIYAVPLAACLFQTPSAAVRFLEMAKDSIVVIEISSSSDEETPPRANVRRPAGTISSVKKEKPAKPEKPPEDLDCFILDFDPFASIDLSKKLVISDSDDTDEVSIVSERGPVACRDYPHSRHLCAKFPFNKTSHESYCQQCYCFICETIAPCKEWSGIAEEHCHASDHDPKWKLLRINRRIKQAS